jgi:putative toxin-antitoxin system antitoxin component (TIGR02293 family)
VNASDPVARLQDRAIEVFGAKDRAIDWCYSAIAGLGGRRPIDLLETRPGRRAVFEELGRIEHGVF